MTAPSLIAAVGDVGEGFFKERDSASLPCQAKPDEVFCFDWARENIDRFGTPTLQHLELVLFSVVLGFAVAFALSLLAHRTAWLRPPLLAGTGVLYTIPSLAFFFLLLPTRCRSSTATRCWGWPTSPARSRTRPAGWA